MNELTFDSIRQYCLDRRAEKMWFRGGLFCESPVCKNYTSAIFHQYNLTWHTCYNNSIFIEFIGIVGEDTGATISFAPYIANLTSIDNDITDVIVFDNQQLIIRLKNTFENLIHIRDFFKSATTEKTERIRKNFGNLLPKWDDNYYLLDNTLTKEKYHFSVETLNRIKTHQVTGEFADNTISLYNNIIEIQFA